MPRFFGLTPSDKVVFLEPMFVLMYYMGFTYQDAYTLPVWQRQWFLERLISEVDKSGQTKESANDPMYNTMAGKHRQTAPARLRRFT